MKFNLKKPCKGCPFRRDCLPGWLGEERAEEIATSILADNKTFPCHETTDATLGKFVPLRDTSHCAGALALVELTGEPNAMIQIAERLGLWDGKVDTAGVFESAAEFIEHHAR